MQHDGRPIAGEGGIQLPATLAFLRDLPQKASKEEFAARVATLASKDRGMLTRDFAPWMKWEPRSFLTDEWVMTADPEVIGVYVLLLNHEWMEGSIPNDPRLVSRLTGAHPDRIGVIWPIVRDRFAPASPDSEDRLVNDRLEATRDDALAEIFKNVLDGKWSAAKRWNKKDREETLGKASPLVQTADDVARGDLAPDSDDDDGYPLPSQCYREAEGNGVEDGDLEIQNDTEGGCGGEAAPPAPGHEANGQKVHHSVASSSDLEIGSKGLNGEGAYQGSSSESTFAARPTPSPMSQEEKWRNRGWVFGEPVPFAEQLEEMINLFPRRFHKQDRESLNSQWVRAFFQDPSPPSLNEMIAACRRYAKYIGASELRQSRINLTEWLVDIGWVEEWRTEDAWIEALEPRSERETTRFRVKIERKHGLR